MQQDGSIILNDTGMAVFAASAMMTKPVLNAPFVPEEITVWAARNHKTLQEARWRFVASMIIFAVASDPKLSKDIVLRGSSALELCYDHPRCSGDLDFVSLSHSTPQILQPDLPELFSQISQAIHRMFSTVVPTSHDLININGTSVRFDISPSVIQRPLLPMEVKTSQKLTPLVFCLEDLIAEKLAALLLNDQILQKPRSQDLYDLAWIILTSPGRFSSELVAQLFVSRQRYEKLESIAVPSIADLRASLVGPYEKFTPLNTTHPIPFYDAWSAVTTFFDSICQQK